VDQPLNGRNLRIWVDTKPCAATVAAAVANSTALAALIGPVANETLPVSVSAYEFAAAANLTKPCPAATASGAGAAPARRAAAAAGVALLLAAVLL
jgi:hypothetical protein